MKGTCPLPPRWATRLLHWLCAAHLVEEVEGDLDELFRQRVQSMGAREARLRYVRDVLSLMRPFAIQRKSNQYSSPFLLSPVMVRNYFKIALRNLVCNQAFSAINIMGLALGMACSLLIMLWVQDERSVDGFHVNGKQLYQVYQRQYYDGKIDGDYPAPGLLADELKKGFPEVQYASSLEWNNTCTFEAGDQLHKMEGTFAGADFFKMFSYPLLQGTPETALNTPIGMAISRKMAQLFFGSPEKAIGQPIRYENREELLVTAVFENLPTNSSQQFDFLRSWVAYVKENDWVNNWGNTNPVTLVQLRPDADPVKVEAKIKDFIHRYRPKDQGFLVELGLQPYPEKYLHSTFKNGLIEGGRIEYVQLFSLVAVFILLIACINFMNLATARSTKRAKEVGVRKVVGAARSTLMGQFMGEALLLTFFSILVAVMLVALLLPSFNQLTGKQLFLPFEQPLFWVTLLGLLLLTGLFAGSYPAFFLSSLNPIRALKGSGASRRGTASRLKFSWGATFFRKGLVVFQFGLSIILIVGTIVIYRQMDYVQTKNLGYDRENRIYIPIEGDLAEKYGLFKEEAGKMVGVVTISNMRQSPTVIGHHPGDIDWTGKAPNLHISFANTPVGYDFVKTMKLKLTEGRDFSKDFGTDSASYLVNETAIKKIGYQNPIGQPLTWGNHPGKIIGVLKDFHFNSMRETIEPLVIRLDEKQPWGTILVRTEVGKTKAVLANLGKVCKALNPNFPFTYQFSDQEYAKLYQSEQVVSQLSSYFAFLTIFISCLGLFGLAAFTAEQRTKEIGVRKVFGASVSDIVGLLSKEFLKLVLVAIVISSPLAWWIMNQWLDDFAYKIAIGWWVFALAGLLAIGIALLTASFQAVKAALMNPVKSLRTE